MRATDLVGQLSSAIAVILLHTAGSDALRVAERIRASIEQVAFREGPEGRPQRLTVSVGKVSFPNDGHTDAILLSQALAYLDQAVERGGNQVTHSSGTPRLGVGGAFARESFWCLTNRWIWPVVVGRLAPLRGWEPHFVGSLHELELAVRAHGRPALVIVNLQAPLTAWELGQRLRGLGRRARWWCWGRAGATEAAAARCRGCSGWSGRRRRRS